MGKYTGEQFKKAVEEAVKEHGSGYFKGISDVIFSDRSATIKHKSNSGKTNLFTKFELTDDDKVGFYQGYYGETRHIAFARKIAEILKSLK